MIAWKRTHNTVSQPRLVFFKHSSKQRVCVVDYVNIVLPLESASTTNGGNTIIDNSLCFN